MTDDATVLPPLPAGADYVALLAEGMALIQRLSGEVWTNHNWSDPGVTILQQLCYALTELTYRASFPAADLLADPATGRVRLRRQGLYPARAIMPVNPVTVADLRRLLLDRVADIANAWVTPLPPALARGVGGLYQIALFVPDIDPCCPDHGPDPETVRRRVRDCYTAHRALCEDIERIVILRTIPARIAAEVQLDDHADPDQVLADMLFAAALALAPEPRRHSLDAALLAGQTTSEIFDGPLMLRGFIADDQLTPRPLRMPVDYLLEILAEVPGVLSVSHLVVEVAGHRYHPGETIAIDDDAILVLDSAAAIARGSIRLHHGAARCPVDTRKVQRHLDRVWTAQHRTYPLGPDYRRHYPPPTGRRADLTAYESVQDQFPAVYGIGRYGLPSGASAPRTAQVHQLKGYLMVFDQLMADFCAQIGFTRDLFSVSAGGARTYAWQSLRGIVPDADAVLSPGYAVGMTALIAAGDPVAARQNAVLDFLLSLYAEQLVLPADSGCGDALTPPADALVEAKRTLLARMVPATRDRGRGFDYLRLAGDSAAAGLDIRCRIELSLLESILRSDGATIVADPDAASFGRLLPPELGAVAAQTFLPVDLGAAEGVADGPSPLTGHSVAAALLPALGDPARYRLGALDGGGPVYLLCQDFDHRCWVVGELQDAAQAVALTHRLLRAVTGTTELTLVEWVLLRYAGTHPEPPPPPPAPPPSPHCCHCDCKCHCNCPPTPPAPPRRAYSFRISAVLPACEDDARADGWREQASQIVRTNMPSHTLVDPVFLHHCAMRQFHTLHRAWTDALRTADHARRAQASRNLVEFLERHQPGLQPHG